MLIKIIILVSIICFLLIFSCVLWYYWYLFPPSFIDVVRDIRDMVWGLAKDPNAPVKYSINDTDFRIEEYASGFSQPTTMAFLGDKQIVLEKNSGQVWLIQNGFVYNKPLLDFNVNSYWESGLLGVTVNGNDVYFYLTEADEEDGGEKI